MTFDDRKVRNAWDQNAQRWADRVRAGVDLYREVFNTPSFLAILPNLAGREVVDLGCGEGTNTRLLALRGARMTGIDISHQMISLARAEEEREPLGITYKVASYASRTSFPDSHFAAAVSTMSLMDSSNYSATVKETYRLLKPGSPFIFSVLHPCFVTPSIRWLKDQDGGDAELVVSNYFDERPFVDSRRFSKDPDVERFEKFEIPRFPRRLETYVNGLIEAGFRITRLIEPQPTAEMVDKHPWLARWRTHAAIFLYVVAEKPDCGY
jgi:SAM-dependent methyltransferase